MKNNLPKNMLHLSSSSLLNFLAGFIDGDGYFNKEKSSIEIYVNRGDIKTLEGIIIASLRIGILPRVRKRKSIYTIILPNYSALNKILNLTSRVHGKLKRRTRDIKQFSPNQLIGDIWNKVDWKGTLWNYVKKSSLIGIEKLISYLKGRILRSTLKDLEKIRDSDLTGIRLKKVKFVRNKKVFNLTIESKSELDHNFIVFTSLYTPIVVGNCHAAIVSREMGIPCIVGTVNATETLKDREIVTIDAHRGLVYSGEIEIKKEAEALPSISIEEARELKTKTKILMNLGVPEKIDEYKDLPFEGIGLMRIEFIIASYIGEHPNYLLEIGQEQKYIDKLAEGIAKVAGAIKPRFVVVRFSDFKTNEYRELKGGEKYEPEEANPMLGWRGVSRYTSPEFEKAFRLECRAIKKVRDEFKLNNVWVMLPFVRTTWEVEKCLEIMKSEGLKKSEDFKIWLMAEVPSIIFQADEFSKLCDAFSIGSNDLTQLILGVDRDSAVLGKMGYFDERNPAVLRAINHLIKIAHQNNVTVSICGQAPSVYPEFTEFLIKSGIDSVSVNPDTVVQTVKLVADIEKKIKTEEAATFEL
jgi:phosphoenolpyruvate synthase/pyruvate phosphate dikinase